jgi:uncharacterized protein YraI
MHSHKGLLAAIAISISSTAAAASSAVVTAKLNLRAGPGPAFQVVTVMAPGTTVTVERCNDEWCRVRFERWSGYASRAYLGDGSDSLALAASSPPQRPTDSKPTLTGPHVWRWNDHEWRDRHWRLLGWHNRLQSR